MNSVKPLEPIFTAHLFAELERLLIKLLRSLGADEWERPTVAPLWKVRDVTAHLLDTQLRILSIARDGQALDLSALASDAGLTELVNHLNHEGVSFYRRLSPDVLISLMEIASREHSEYQRSLDPFAKARFGVSWAGEEESRNWFNTAREFTERWHHQQQIRLATDRPGIMTREFYNPVLDTFMRALPFHYREVSAKPGSLAQFDVSGECGGSWYLYRDEASWKLTAEPLGDKITEVTIPREIAWRVFTKGIDRDGARERVSVVGDRVGLHVLSMLSIIG
jgi:uncharacterized protein (TIGR03083 family)